MAMESSENWEKSEKNKEIKKERKGMIKYSFGT